MSGTVDGTEYWDRQALRDPLWAILSESQKREGKWDVSSFFQTGTHEIASILYELDAQGFELRRRAALDFGCGVGRLTQALAPHFERVVGVDVSSRMHDLASRLNQHPATVSYVCNQATDLGSFEDGSFDFIVSSIVLQHIRPESACAYLREFFRVLAPGGMAVFQLPSHRRRPQSRPLEAIAKPMPDDAYRASLAVAALPPRMTPGSQVVLQVDLTNASPFDWVQREYGVLSVGDHRLDATGHRMLARDDGRARLPAILRAGDACRVMLTINAPADRGEYQCEVDVAHEGVLWFRDRGSETVRRPVRIGEEEEDGVRAAAQPEPAPATPAREARGGIDANIALEDPGEFPMYGVPLNAVVRLIAEAGAHLLHVDNDRSCGDDWVSYRYYVRRSARAPGP